MRPSGDGRDAAEAACTPLACKFEHCFQQHKYVLAAPCRQLWDAYEACVAAERRARGLRVPAAPAPVHGRPR